DATQLCVSNGAALDKADQVAQTLQGLNPPTSVPKPSKTLADQTGQLAIQVAVSACAGGKWGPDGSADGTAAQGYWHGYTLIRLFTDGRRYPTIEQRPVFDWIGIRAKDH